MNAFSWLFLSAILIGVAVMIRCIVADLRDDGFRIFPVICWKTLGAYTLIAAYILAFIACIMVAPPLIGVIVVVFIAMKIDRNSNK